MPTITQWCDRDTLKISAGVEIHAAVREHFKDVQGGHKCKLCGEVVAHPRAAMAHMGVHHPDELAAEGDVEAYGTSGGAEKGWDSRGRSGSKDNQGRTGGRKLSGRLGPEHFDSLEKLAQSYDKAASEAEDKDEIDMHKGDASDIRKFSSLVKQGNFKAADRHASNMDTDPREKLYTFRRVGPAISRAWQQSDPKGYARHANYLDQSTWRRSAGGTKLGTKSQDDLDKSM